MRAARLGDTGGIRGVGLMHYLGESVPVNKQEAAAWMLVAASAGNKDAQDSLDRIIEDLPALDHDAVIMRAEAIAANLSAQ